MKNTLLIVGILTFALGLAACGGATNVNVNAKPANAANTTNTNAAPANTASNSTATNTATAPATAGAEQDFTLVNKTGVIIDKLFVSPSDKDDWQEDILGQDTLADGGTVEIKFHPKEKAAKWDLRVEDSKGNSIEWTDLNLTEISKVTLHYKDGKGTAEVE